MIYLILDWKFYFQLIKKRQLDIYFSNIIKNISRRKLLFIQVTSLDLKRIDQIVDEDDVQPVKFYDINGNENGVVIA